MQKTCWARELEVEGKDGKYGWKHRLEPDRASGNMLGVWGFISQAKKNWQRFVREYCD